MENMEERDEEELLQESEDWEGLPQCGLSVDREGDACACCPRCRAMEDDIDLEYGDHGYKCSKCGERFIVP